MPPRTPQLASLRAERRANPLLPWAAGAALSVLVLALTVPDQGWLEHLAGGWPAAPEAVAVGAPPTSAVPAPEVTAAPTVPGTVAKSPPRIVPISPAGRGTARTGSRPDAAGGLLGAPERSLAPRQPDATGSRVIPISLERPQAASIPAVQLVGATADDGPAGVELIDFSDPRSGDASAPPAGLRLFIHYRAGPAEDAAIAARLAEYLRRRGFEVAPIRAVELPIQSPGVRYFFARDQVESERLLDDLGWFFRGMPWAAPERASDFTHYTPRPSPGTVEIWLPAVS